MSNVRIEVEAVERELCDVLEKLGTIEFDNEWFDAAKNGFAAGLCALEMARREAPVE